MTRAWLIDAAVVVGLTIGLVGFEYPSLPTDNLIENPWFRIDCEASLDGWSVRDPGRDRGESR